MRIMVQVVLLLSLSLSQAVSASELLPKQSELPKQTVAMVQDLERVSRTAQDQTLPILLVYSAEDCEYCQRLESDLLNPMLLGGDFEKRIIVRKVMIDSGTPIKDFDGSTVEPEQFAYRRGIEFTPTLQFVDAQGNKLVPNMIGYQAEFYGAYLENAIGGSLLKVKRVEIKNVKVNQTVTGKKP